MRGYWLRRAISAVEAAESSLREKLRKKIQESHLVRRYKVERQMLLLKELMTLLEDRTRHCYVVGGFAADGLAGRIGRRHSDIDLTFLDTEADVVFSVLRENGYKVNRRTIYSSVAWKQDLHVDLFEWKDAGAGMVQHMAVGKIVRVPAEFLGCGQSVELLGVRYRIPCNEYLVSALPFVSVPAHRKLFLSLPLEAPLRAGEWKETIDVPTEVTIHEFRQGNEPVGQGGEQDNKHGDRASTPAIQTK